ncbi:TIGR02680 family protein [Actinoalloteichus sp. GBA129-24]|uniref:TIGR02680 family protein n=1 Tax=Actinoalloteichus sp. GBA129-24 TaxID=1612551 RepID=UPI0009508F4E|nr:TIGR02680 family protein [Actinoalloteichus sp. GBA129-24]APU23152.1 putative TIGR02680 family protein [Actinoalloteichus sp. GBA129-24]
MSESGRWRLHRGGIVNIWQYAEQTFDLSGGRAIFQGTNGSGKSRTLELLLPLCLDGDLRQLGSKGFDTVSIRRLMLDDYTGGPNRIGYAWVELARTAPAGPEKDPADQDGAAPDALEYLTCGIGVKASKTSQQITDSWRFITTRRIGVDLRLVGVDEVPLSAAGLRDVLGPDCVLDESTFRARVAELVYRLPAARYGDLLHLQRTLRNPDVGLKVLEGQLEQILSDALPPLDTTLVESLAGSFDDLEAIRENIIGLSTADRALSTFVAGYSGYAAGSLRKLGRQMSAAAEELAALRAELADLERRGDKAFAEREAAAGTVRRLETEESELEVRIDGMKSMPAYQGLRDLEDREALVAAGRASAQTALETAGRQRGQEDRAVDAVLGVLRRLHQDASAARELADAAAARLAAAGLDPSLCPTVPPAPSVDVEVRHEPVLAKPDPGSEPLPVERRHLPALSPEMLTDQLQAAAGVAERATAETRRRVALISSLHQQAAEADRAGVALAQSHRDVRAAQVAATEAAGRRHEADQRLGDAAERWRDRARAWFESASHAPAGERFDALHTVPELPSTADLQRDLAAPRAVRDAARAWCAPGVASAAARTAAARGELSRVRGAIEQRDRELAGTRSGERHRPPTAGWVEHDQDATRGAPFYRLVDFRPEVEPADQAGLEAALTASGLLTAWVDAAGAARLPASAELLAVSDGTTLPPGRTLAELLIPADDGDSPVAAEVVEALLRTVSVDTPGSGAEPSTSLTVSTSGRWSAGVLRGAWHKDAAEYVGAGARKAARMRRIVELEDELDSLRGEQAAAERALTEAVDAEAELVARVESFPDDGELIAAHASASSARGVADEAATRAESLRARHRLTEQREQAVAAELARAGASAGLSSDSAELAAARQAAEQARETIERLAESLSQRAVRTVADLAEGLRHLHAAEQDRVEAERQAEQACSSHAEQAAALAELTDAVGREAGEVADLLAALEQRRVDCRAELPAARERVAALRERAAKVATLTETRQAQLDGRAAQEERATAAFRESLRTPGLWAAAVAEAGQDVPRTPPADPAEALRLLGEGRAGAAVSEASVIGRLQALQAALAGTHDIQATEQAGVLCVTVSSADGPRPVAEAASRVAEQLGRQRGFLGERYQTIFSDYLIRDLAERLRGQIAVAEDLCRRMNDVLDRARSSQGVHVQLEWRPSAALDEPTRQALELVRTPFADRDGGQDEALRRALTERIEAERDTRTGGYAEILTRALDYRGWHAFTVRVRDDGPDGRPRVRRLRQLSSGETRLVSYVTLFAAAASFYDAVGAAGTEETTVEPLRLVLLDEAFERLDDPTIARMLGLLVDVDMDWLITWPSGWGVSPKIPRMHIYDVLRPKSGGGLACTHTTWDGRDLTGQDR